MTCACKNLQEAARERRVLAGTSLATAAAMLTGCMLRLVIYNTRDNRRVIRTFDRLPVSIGRYVDNRVQLDDPAVSRHHVVVEWNGPKIVLCDLGSTNGTFFQGFPLARREPREIRGDKFDISVGPFHVFGERDAVEIVPIDGPTRKASADELQRLARPEDAVTLVRRRRSG
jgi:pSer/pThr/pTyr-binding forkhead associated (FHA) protein